MFKKNLNIVENKTFYFLILITFVYVISIIYKFYMSNYSINGIHYFIFPILLFFVFISVNRNHLKSFTYLLILLISILYLIFTPFYSPIDEGVHFDYILHIIQHNSLPTLYDDINQNELLKVTGNYIPSGLQYEAVHPPLYYLISSFIVILFKNHVLLAFFILRFLGIFYIMGSLWLVIKSYYELIRQQKIVENNPVFFSIIIVFFLNPGFLTRMITISNEQLVVLLMSLLIYLLIKYQSSPIMYKHIIILSIISGAMILTKFTSIYVLGVVTLYLLLNKYFKKIFLYVSVSLLIMLPWVLYNWNLYRSITGTQMHVEYVKKIANPNNQLLDWNFVLQKLTLFLGSFWQPQESRFPNVEEPLSFGISTFNNILLYSFLFVLIFSVISFFKRKKEAYLYLILCGSIFLNIAVICYGTLTESVDIIIGRYIYMNIISFIFILFFSIDRLIQHKYKVLSTFLIVLLSFTLSSSYLFNIIQNKGNIVERYLSYSAVKYVSIDNYTNQRSIKFINNGLLNVLPFNLGKEFLESTKQYKKFTLSFAKESNDVILEKNNVIKMNGIDPYVVYNLKDSYSPYNVEDVIHFNISGLDSNKINKNSSIQLYWNDGSGFSEENSLKFDVVDNGNYLIPIGVVSKWNNKKAIYSVRFDIDNLPDQSIQLEQVEILKLNNN